MESNIYKLLGLPNTAMPEEVENAYTFENAKLSEERFKSGIEGNEAARKLNDLNIEYRMYKDNQNQKQQGGNTGFEEVDRLIKSDNIDAAQSLLDGMMDRNGEWHYMQSIIFYKRDWISECRKHLNMAINLDPTNQKYKNALDKLDQVVGNGQANAQNFGSQARYSNNQSDYRRGQTDQLCNCLLCYCILSSCCR
ncbi:MAG: hypothetical protein FWF56_02735 [Firmicutes bacterium]|nr:hypothetical protein [Bacillota bacterium]MCL1953259.1 hypothetical protein [Bacillota bacterium]